MQPNLLYFPSTYTTDLFLTHLLLRKIKYSHYLSRNDTLLGLNRFITNSYRGPRDPGTNANPIALTIWGSDICIATVATANATAMASIRISRIIIIIIISLCATINAAFTF